MEAGCEGVEFGSVFFFLLFAFQLDRNLPLIFSSTQSVVVIWSTR
jgi:hypothetical protein